MRARMIHKVLILYPRYGGRPVLFRHSIVGFWRLSKWYLGYLSKWNDPVDRHWRA